MSKRISIFYSALLLTLVNLLLRAVATSFQVYLSSRIGAEGVGLLQLVLSVGAMAMVAGMAGIRTATMYLTAEELGRRKSGTVTWVLSGCLIYSLLCSGTVALILYILAPWIAENWIQAPEVIPALRLYCAFLPVNCLTGVMVGYFTGANRIGTLAMVEIAEQVCTMIFTVLLLGWSANQGSLACQAVIMGSGLGACVTLLALVILRLVQKPPTDPRIPIARRLTGIALPLAVADDLRTGIVTLENLMVPRRLALFPGTVSPLAAFGIICGMVFPVLTFPMAILFGLCELLVPELARCNAAGNSARIRHLVRKSLHVALLYGLICGGILYLSADALCQSLYKNSDAGTYLKWFAPLSVMLYCDAVTDAMIKGLGQQKASVRYNILTNLMDVTFLYFLLPKYGVWGYFLSFAVTHGVNYLLSIRRLLKITGQQLRLSVPLYAIISTLGAIGITRQLPHTLWRSGSFVIAAIALYFLTGVVSGSDLLWVRGLVRRTEPVH